MIDAKALLDRYLGAENAATVERHARDLKTRAQDNPLAATAIAGGLAALLLGTKAGAASAAGAPGSGGMAAVAGLAYKAYQDWQAGQGGGAAPARDGGDARDGVMLPPADSEFMPSGWAPSRSALAR